MHPKKTLAALCGTAATAAMLFAPIAGAEQTARPAVATPAKVTGTYLYIQKLPGAGGPHGALDRYATLVFKTDRQLPRRYDGLIRAGARIAGQGGSLGSVHGRASRCYEMLARIKPDNTITGTTSHGVKQTKARAGSRLPVEITTGDGAPTVKRTLTLRNAHAGDAIGKPLGC
jgi:hypothetical protein